MSFRVAFDLPERKLQFEELPIGFIPFRSEGDVELTVADAKTNVVSTVYFQAVEFSREGIPTELVDLKEIPVLLGRMAKFYARLKEARPLLESMSLIWDEKLICQKACAIYYEKLMHSPKTSVPGIYFCPGVNQPQLFINLNEVPSIFNNGNFFYKRKVRKALWLNAESNLDTIVAKKVVVTIKEWEHGRIKNEIEVLDNFSGIRGVVQKIASATRFIDGRINWVIFFPLYETDLFKLIEEQPFSLSKSEQLDLMEDWLQGLTAIAKIGIHADIKPSNVLIRRREGKVEGVITDFETFTWHEQPYQGGSSPLYAAPEYPKSVTNKLDVWNLGYCFLTLVIMRDLFYEQAKVNPTPFKKSSNLGSHWSLAYLQKINHSPFSVTLIDQMVEPNLEKRPNADFVLNSFSKGRGAAFE